MTGPVVIVTGAASGIGRAVALEMKARNASLWLADLIRPAESLLSDGVRFFQGDVGEEPFVRDFIAECTGAEGRLDGVVHCVGSFEKRDLESTGLEDWDAVVRTNVTSGFLVLKHATPTIVRSGGGSMVLFGSAAGLDGGYSCGPAYAASKAAVHGLVKWAARRLAPHGVRVNAIAPGPVDTPMGTRAGITADRVPLGRLGQPEDLAMLAAFLLSSGGNWITGQVLSPNGGTLI
ncbi:SDR family NAD(P)-dependent oxidoreductase [Nocardia beijingensis]